MSSKPSTTTQTKAPTAGPQSNLFQNVWGGTSGALGTALDQPIPQNTVAGPTPAQTAGAQDIINVAPNLGTNAPAISNLTGQIASGYFSNPWNNPNFEGAVTAALTPSLNQLTGTVIPRIQDASLRASGGGTGPSAYGGVGGGSPQDLLTENVLRDWSTQAQNTGASMAESAYNTGLGLINQIPGLTTAGNTSWLAPAAALEQGGGLQQGWNQAALQNLINRYYLTGQGPLGFLSSAANIGGTGGFGTTTSVGNPPSLATQWLQGLTGGAGALGSLLGKGGLPGLFGGAGAGAAGAGGTAFGATDALGNVIGAETVGSALPSLGTAAGMGAFLGL